ncbi:RNA polymerase sigma-70 factor [Fulvivirgaceae bacterium BMA10]|uniref:RNA polymerase sigma factor n=1 Tax=Splendidivirga corallicola TaxID=3051826 RepID=A0ABT8KHW2_9BACT|nr:RNA polymerase sigma-70 factor [Fulvivirgaceae bacterium BMA10]
MEDSYEKRLVEKLKGGCRKSFRKLFDTYHQKIYSVSRKMGLQAEDAEEVVQEVFLFIWEKRERLRSENSINAFLLIISKRLVLKKIRKNINNISLDLFLDKLKGSVDNNTEDYIIFSDLEAYSHIGLNNLPEKRKQIFMLSKQHGLSNDEIADKLKISKRTVESHLYKATKAVREHLEKEHINSDIKRRTGNE